MRERCGIELRNKLLRLIEQANKCLKQKRKGVLHPRAKHSKQLNGTPAIRKIGGSERRNFQVVFPVFVMKFYLLIYSPAFVSADPGFERFPCFLNVGHSTIR